MTTLTTEKMTKGRERFLDAHPIQIINKGSTMKKALLFSLERSFRSQLMRPLMTNTPALFRSKRNIHRGAAAASVTASRSPVAATTSVQVLQLVLWPVAFWVRKSGKATVALPLLLAAQLLALFLVTTLRTGTPKPAAKLVAFYEEAGGGRPIGYLVTYEYDGRTYTDSFTYPPEGNTVRVRVSVTPQPPAYRK